MSDTPETIAAAIGALDAPALRTLAGLLGAELARDRAAVLSSDEIRNRAGVLASCALTAGREHFSRLICPICKSMHRNESSLRRHLIRTHADDIAAMPATKFTPATGGTAGR